MWLDAAISGESKVVLDARLSQNHGRNLKRRSYANLNGKHRVGDVGFPVDGMAI